MRVCVCVCVCVCACACACACASARARARARVRVLYMTWQQYSCISTVDISVWLDNDWDYLAKFCSVTIIILLVYVNLSVSLMPHSHQLFLISTCLSAISFPFFS